MLVVKVVLLAVAAVAVAAGILSKVIYPQSNMVLVRMQWVVLMVALVVMAVVMETALVLAVQREKLVETLPSAPVTVSFTFGTKEEIKP